MAATSDRETLSTLLKAALALPILALPVRVSAVESGEAGLSVLGYKERGLMKVTEPLGWVRLQLGQGWEVQASALIDVVTGASPRLVTNESGQPVQSITGASINDRRKGGDLRIAKRFGEWTLAAVRTRSDEEDYWSRAYGLEARWEPGERLTAFTAGYGKSNDRVRSSDNPQLDERRDTEEYLVGVTQVLSPLAIVQGSVQVSRGQGFYDDPYKVTLTFYPDGSLPLLARDHRPDHRESVAALVKYRQHLPDLASTLQVDYRYFRDDWGVRAHTVEVGWSRDLGPEWSIRPALRYATQSAADFYSPTIARPRPDVQSSDQRLAAYGSLSPSLRLTHRFDPGLTLEATVGAYRNAASLRAGGGGSSAYETLTAWYAVAGATWSF